jgi:hypothetical protein
MIASESCSSSTALFLAVVSGLGNTSPSHTTAELYIAITAMIVGSIPGKHRLLVIMFTFVTFRGHIIGPYPWQNRAN